MIRIATVLLFSLLATAGFSQIVYAAPYLLNGHEEQLSNIESRLGEVSSNSRDSKVATITPGELAKMLFRAKGKSKGFMSQASLANSLGSNIDLANNKMSYPPDEFLQYLKENNNGYGYFDLTSEDITNLSVMNKKIQQIANRIESADYDVNTAKISQAEMYSLINEFQTTYGNFVNLLENRYVQI